MKKITQSITILAVVTILVLGAGCTNNNTDFNTGVVTPPIDDEIVSEDMVVTRYMQHTLGSIPGADVDYEKAKKYLTEDLKAQFTNPMFVPSSYCIQDGPDNVRVASNELGTGTIDIVVEGQYGGKWQKMWQFSLVPDGDLSWLISKITCLNE